MSYQVGLLCYDSLASAGEATCAAHTPITSIDATGVIRVVTCESADTTTGALNLKVTTNNGTTTTQSTVQMPVSFPTCHNDKIITAGLTIVGAFITMWAVVYSIKKIHDWVNHRAMGADY